MTGAPTAAQLAKLSKAMYQDGPLLLRTLQHWRPYICPFENLLGHVPEGSRVLDIGCGSGLLLGLTAGVGVQFEGVGFDVSRQGIELATRMSRSASVAPNAKLSFLRLDIGDAWPEGTFDVVFLVDVLHHVAPGSQEKFFRQALSKVGREGVLVYKDMCRSPWWRAQANRLQDLLIAREWINYVPVQTVEQWAAEDGMKVRVREEMNRFWCGHERRVKRSANGALVYLFRPDMQQGIALGPIYNLNAAPIRQDFLRHPTVPWREIEEEILAGSGKLVVTDYRHPIFTQRQHSIVDVRVLQRGVFIGEIEQPRLHVFRRVIPKLQKGKEIVDHQRSALEGR